ncbi:hypothetical protein A3J20_02435 [Candidatus Gottesmanbacteria bacterium RIFCSPLOWO2_02_FULL_42_29]|uniref:SGNH hydrolase-type esterase domain-containing protein n=1 Tax=Candidatus Gottesmanbacteria bacterium RIFCSPLOWO2_01_FULL_42_22 TaxID=1798391 RepID=A0A1F6BB58_9BACT|nr:MAG: hypothetical protein A2781_04030 [Candidatus Gottesmanbacteria bacterium RIFCSPHIGHO2_01_FULL_42_27]OGG34140.1 MAG: hypothetical protein A2968_03125 [Candidatus Gottesmanbacteria bacterium RIFCSPLOWO2_01_FULL_42_22]OGG34398.1 MAG: hypothetical protein A3G68_03710 [Candidatus Gottesmanbacteria bacterium RIFCSPLOWO2_12_FULL_42_10]OGG37916.1 MAG: hypothetical protein A3J20_02435 [Candidatus Gottesmanbacteria bacterium RIFCSPLOWO2_02_FULL_42_29]
MTNFKKIYLFIFISFLLLLVFILSINVTNKYKKRINSLSNENYSYEINKKNNTFGNSELTSFYEPKPNSTENITADWLGYEIEITMNNDGLNDRYDYELYKPLNTFRIVTLGDSHTYGVYLKTQDNWSEKLEDILNRQLNCPQYKKFEVINLGVHGYDLMYSFERFKKRGLKYNPDLIIWFVNNWNFQNINEYYYPRREELLKMGYKDFNGKNSKFEISEKIFKELPEMYGKNGILDYQKKVIDNLRVVFKNRLLFVSYNDLGKTSEEFFEDFTKTEKRISFLKLSFNSNSSQELFFPDRHPNQKGHFKISEELYKNLISSTLKGCITN